MKIGELNSVNMRQQSTRTITKLDENLTQLIKNIEGARSRTDLQFALYSALRWTADDVLAQAIADGYKPTR